MSSRVYGSVTDAATGSLITTATVTASPYSVINSSGSYYFIMPAGGTVSVTASAPNYTPQTKDVTVGTGQVKLLNFALNHV